MRARTCNAVTAATVLALGLLLSACSGRAQPMGTFRSIADPFQGVSAMCWPLPTAGPLGFGWLPASVTVERDRARKHSVLEYQVFGPDPRIAVSDVATSLTDAGFTALRTRHADEARLYRPDFGPVRISARSVPGAGPGVPVTAVLTFDELSRSARPLLTTGLCHHTSGQE